MKLTQNLSNYKIWVIESSASEGNCIIVQDHNKLMLFDLGISESYLKSFMVKNHITNRGILNQHFVDKLHFDYVFITHHHQDHNKGLNSLIYDSVITWDYLFTPRKTDKIDFIFDNSTQRNSDVEFGKKYAGLLGLLDQNKLKKIANFHENRKRSPARKLILDAEMIKTGHINLLGGMSITWSDKFLSSFGGYQTNKTNKIYDSGGINYANLIDCYSYFIDGVLYITDTSLTQELWDWQEKFKVVIGLIEANHSIREFEAVPLFVDEKPVGWSKFRPIDRYGHLSNENHINFVNHHRSKFPAGLFLGTHPSKYNLELIGKLSENWTHKYYDKPLLAVPGMQIMWINNKWIIK